MAFDYKILIINGNKIWKTLSAVYVHLLFCQEQTNPCFFKYMKAKNTRLYILYTTY